MTDAVGLKVGSNAARKFADRRSRKLGGELAGLGACSGDSDRPLLDTRDGELAVLGMVSWSTGPALSAGCGGLTGIGR